MMLVPLTEPVSCETTNASAANAKRPSSGVGIVAARARLRSRRVPTTAAASRATSASIDSTTPA